MHDTIAQSNPVFAHFHPATPTHAVALAQSPDGSGRILLLGLALVALTLLLAPFGLVLAHLALDPQARAMVAAQPAMALQLGAGIVVLVCIFGWPAAHLSRTAVVWRTITIECGLVRMVSRGLFGRRTWAEPLASYHGVAAQVRSSLSGVRHELVLQHPRAERCVVLYSGPAITREMVAAAAQGLRVAEIPSREPVSVPASHGPARSSEPQPRLAA
jgi:hypothetical protein